MWIRLSPCGGTYDWEELNKLVTTIKDMGWTTNILSPKGHNAAFNIFLYKKDLPKTEATDQPIMDKEEIK